MKKELFEEKIWNEILIDCKDDIEQNMSWFYYVQDELEFPFIAYVALKELTGREVLKRVNVVRMSSDDSNFEKNFNLTVEVEFDDCILEFPLSKLERIKASESTVNVIEIWNYWIRK